MADESHCTFGNVSHHTGDSQRSNTAYCHGKECVGFCPCQGSARSQSIPPWADIFDFDWSCTLSIWFFNFGKKSCNPNHWFPSFGEDSSTPRWWQPCTSVACWYRGFLGSCQPMFLRPTTRDNSGRHEELCTSFESMSPSIISRTPVLYDQGQFLSPRRIMYEFRNCVTRSIISRTPVSRSIPARPQRSPFDSLSSQSLSKEKTLYFVCTYECISRYVLYV